MLAISAGFANGVIVGGRSIDVTVTPTEISVVLPPDIEIVTQISAWSASGIWPGYCSLVEPSRSLTEDYAVVVGRTLVDASSWPAGVLMVISNAEEICGRLSSGVGCFGGTC